MRGGKTKPKQIIILVKRGKKNMDVLKYGSKKYYTIGQILSELDKCRETKEIEKLKEKIFYSCDLREVYKILKKYGYEIIQENCEKCLYAEHFINYDNLIYCTKTKRTNYKCRWCQCYGEGRK